MFKPLTNEIRELRLTGNDFYGVMAFNLVYHIDHFDKFLNIRVFEFEGQVEEATLVKFLHGLRRFKSLSEIIIYNKGRYFDTKQLLDEPLIREMLKKHSCSENAGVSKFCSKF